MKRRCAWSRTCDDKEASHSWITRYCADMTTRRIYEPQSYIKVETYNRIFIWAEDVTEAVAKMSLVAGG